MKCQAKSKRTGKQCNNPPILGAAVCRMHGGSAPQVQRKARERLALAQITPDRTLLEIARVAYSDVASFFNADGSLKTPAELNEDQRACLAGFEACIKNTEAGDGKQDLIHKFKAWDKVRALEMLAQHFKLLGNEKEKEAPIIIKAQHVQIAQVMNKDELTELRERIRNRIAANAGGDRPDHPVAGHA